MMDKLDTWSDKLSLTAAASAIAQTLLKMAPIVAAISNSDAKIVTWCVLQPKRHPSYEKKKPHWTFTRNEPVCAV